MSGCFARRNSRTPGLILLSMLVWAALPAKGQWLATGLPLGGSVVSLTADDQYVYAGTSQGKVWRLPLAGLVTGVRMTADRQRPPGTLESYPNPCNASTVLRFTIPEATRGTLKVYDVLGRSVLTAIEFVVPAGTHEVAADLSTLPTGVYLAVLDAGSTRATHRVMLIR